MWIQREITLRPRPRGFHLITDEVESAVPELREVRVGIAHLFIRHTSASLTLNENASPDARRAFAPHFLAGRAPRLRVLLRRRRARGRAVLDPHNRGPGRHARAHQGVAPRAGADAPG